MEDLGFHAWRKNALLSSMNAHSSSSGLERFRRWWKRVFFWQSAPAPSREVTPPNLHDRHLVAAVTAPATLPGWRQLRYFAHVFSQREQQQLWAAIGGTLIFFGIAGGLFLQPHIIQQPTQGGIVTEGLIGNPKWINPVLAPLNPVDTDLSALIFSGLFRASGLVTESDLAQSYQLLEQGKVLEVRVREDARFHDGQPVTADDVVFTVNDAIKNPLWRSPLARAFSSVEAIRVDDFTVQFKHASDPLTINQWRDLLTVGILPAHRWTDANEGSPQLAEANSKPIGSGPYQFETFTRDAKGLILAYTFKAFPGYYGDHPYLEQRVFRFYADRHTAEQALESNQIEALAFLPWSSEEKLRITDGFATKIELPQVATIFLNTEDAVLKQLPVRRALLLAIDRGELVESLGHGTPLQSTFPFLESYTTSSQLTNIEAARTLLEEMRWSVEPGTGLRYLQPAPVTTRGRVATSTTFVTSTPLTISLMVPDQGDLIAVAEGIKRRWSLLGIQVSVETLERADILRRSLTDRTHQAVLYNIMATADSDLLPFWSSNGSLNLSQWSQPQVTNGLISASQASSTDALIAARQRVADAMSAQVPAIFLFRPSYAYITPSTLKGTADIQIGEPSARLSSTLRWYTDTKLRWKTLP